QKRSVNTGKSSALRGGTPSRRPDPPAAFAGIMADLTNEKTVIIVSPKEHRRHAGRASRPSPHAAIARLARPWPARPPLPAPRSSLPALPQCPVRARRKCLRDHRARALKRANSVPRPVRQRAALGLRLVRAGLCRLRGG